MTYFIGRKQKIAYEQNDDAICSGCGNQCGIIAIDDSFDYSGTHCNCGVGGTQQVDIYPASDCCEAEVIGCTPEIEEPDYGI